MRLVVGYLATPSGADGLALGIRLARTLGAQLDICMVLPPDLAPARIETEHGFKDVLAEQSHLWLAEALATVPDDVEAQTHLSFNESFAEGLLHEVSRIDAAAIVLGAAGDGLIGRHAIGSVTNDLLHSAHVPLVLAPRGLRHSTVPRVREVTCAIGNRVGAGLLLNTALRAARATGVPLRLVSLVALDPQHSHRRDTPDVVRGYAMEHAHKTLETAKADLPEDFPVTSMILEGQSIEAAVNQLEWHDGDLIMVGSSRLAQPRHLFLGSTVAKILRVLQVPIVVVPRSEARSA